MPVNQLGQAQMLGEGGPKDQPGIVDQAVVVEGGLDAVGVAQVIASIECSLFLVGFVFQKPLSQKHRSTFLPLQHAATLIPSVDWGLD